MTRCVTAVLSLALLALATPTLAEVETRTLRYRDGDVELVGMLARDPAFEGPRPAVLLVHEWWGLNPYARRRARQLAALGYVTLAVDMYGEGRATQHPEQARTWVSEVTANVETWRRRAALGLARLRAQPGVDAQRVFAIGYCFGGSTVLQLAWSGADLAGVVTFHGGAVPIPTPAEARGARARVLLLEGAEDPFVPPGHFEKLRGVLDAAGVEHELVLYPGAKHSFSSKEADTRGIDGIAYDPEADRKSWARMRAFFAEGAPGP